MIPTSPVVWPSGVSIVWNQHKVVVWCLGLEASRESDDDDDDDDGDDGDDGMISIDCVMRYYGSWVWDPLPLLKLLFLLNIDPVSFFQNWYDAPSYCLWNPCVDIEVLLKNGRVSEYNNSKSLNTQLGLKHSPMLTLTAEW